MSKGIVVVISLHRKIKFFLYINTKEPDTTCIKGILFENIFGSIRHRKKSHEWTSVKYLWKSRYGKYCGA